MTAPEHDANWWKKFTAAPPQLQKAMHSTLKAREILELRTHLKIDDGFELAVYEQRLKEREQAEHETREALDQPRPVPPVSRSVAAGKAPSDVATGQAASTATSGPDRFW